MARLVPVAEDPFTSTAAHATTVPVDYDPFAAMERSVGGHAREFFTGIPGGAVEAVGTGLRGASAAPQTDPQVGLERARTGLDASLSILAEIEKGVADDYVHADLIRRIGAEKSLLPGERIILDEALRGAVQGDAEAVARARAQLQQTYEERLGRPVLPVTERPLWKAGEAVSEFAERHFGPAPGYEDALSRQVGEGVGSLAAGVAVSATAGPVAGTALFTAMGAGEAADRAVQAGASDEDVVRAAGLGLGPGATDVLPVEILLRRLPVPGVRAISESVRRFGGQRVARVMGRIGLQGLVEAAQEGGQQVLQNLIAREVHSPETVLMEGVEGSTGVGGIVGTIAGIGREAVLGIAGRRSRSRTGVRATAVDEVPPPTPEDEASPIATQDIVEGRQRVADALATDEANRMLRASELPEVGTPVRVVRGREVFEGIVEDAVPLDEVRGIGPGLSIVGADGVSRMDVSLAELERLGISIQVLPMPAAEADIEARRVEVEKEARSVADEYRREARKLAAEEARTVEAKPVEVEAAGRVVSPALAGGEDTTAGGAPVTVPPPTSATEVAPETEAVAVDEATDPRVVEVDEQLRRLDEFTVEPATVEPDTTAREVVDEGAAAVETATADRPDAPVELAQGLYEFTPQDLTTDAKAFQYKEGADDAGVTERLQGVRRWDPVKAGVAIVYERRDGTRVVADGHQRLGLAKRMAAEGQAPRIIGVLRREADGLTEPEVRAEAALKNIAEGTGSAFDAATVMRDAPEEALESLPPQSNLVRVAKDIARLDEEPFRMAKAAKLRDSHAAVIGRIAEADAPLQEALVKEFSDQTPGNVEEAESLARLFKENRAPNETTEDLFGEQEVATSFYRERARVIDITIRRLKQDKRVFATLTRNARQIEAAGNVLAGDNRQIADVADQAAFLVQQLATRAGPISDAVKAAARQADETGNYQTAVGEVVRAVKGWVEEGGPEGLGAGQPGAPVAEGRDAGEADVGRPEEAGRADEDVEAEPTAEELEAEGQEPLFQRAPLRSGFPDIPVSTSIAHLKRQEGYEAAKRGGDSRSAARIVRAVFKPEKVAAALNLDDPAGVLVAPVMLQEEAGGPLNRLPHALAKALARALGAETRYDIAQTNVTRHTGATLTERMAGRPEFGGTVEAGRRYVLVDDVATSGATLLEMAAFIEARGGTVAGAVTLAASRGSTILKVRPQSLAKLGDRHGGREAEFRDAFGHGFEALTDREALDLAGVRPDTFAGIVAGRRARGGRGDGPALRRDGRRGGARDRARREVGAGPRARIRVARPFDEARAGIRDDLRRVARETFGARFDVELAESITAPDGGRATGAFDPVNRIAYIALRAEEDGMRNALWHEGLHYLRGAGAFSNPDGTPNAAWRTLERQAKQWRQDYGIDERYAGDVGRMSEATRERLLNEEAIAEALGDYAVRGRETGYGPAVRAALNRIRIFFTRFANALRGRGFRTWEDVFEGDVMSGRAGRRTDVRQTSDNRRTELDRYLQTAWHGSPHRFDRFSTAAVGTGEGAQVNGWGLYFASKKEIADWYRENMAGAHDVLVDGEPLPRQGTLDEIGDALAERLGGVSKIQAASFITKLAFNGGFVEGALQVKRDRARISRDPHEKLEAAEFVRAAEGRISTVRGGATYRVDLAPQEDEYLLWDEPLAAQSDKVKQALRSVAAEYDFLDSWPTEDRWSDFTGRNLYELMVGVEEGHQESASKALLDYGVRGIKYRDQFSRGQEGEGTFNYVIFDDSDVAIEEILLQREQLGIFDTEETEQGEQAVIPGAERVSDRELAERRLAEPLRAKREQRPADEGLFGEPDTQIDLEEAIEASQDTLFQREPSAGDEGAFDDAAKDWSGYDLTGAAAGVKADKRDFARLAEDIKAQLRGTAAVTPPNVEVADQQTTRDLNAVLRFLAPPQAWSKKFPKVHALVRSGIKAEMDMSNRTRRLNRDWDRITKGLSKREFADLTGMMFLGDAEGRAFSEGELQNFVTTDKVRAAYGASRRFLDKLGRFTEQHRKAMALNVLTRRTKLLRQMAAARGIEAAEFRRFYDARADLLQEHRQGKMDPEKFEADLAEATLALHGAAPVNEEYESWAEEADRLETQIRDIRIRRRAGYVPHKFFGRWRIWRQAVDEDGDAVLDDYGEPTWQEVAGEHGFWPTRREAVLAAGHLARKDPDAALKVAPEEFEFPQEQATTLGDAAYWRFMGNVENLLGLQGEELREAVQGVARRRFRRRIADFEQYRLGIEGYSRDLDRVMRTHIGQTVRYVSLDRLKYDAINTIEREGLSPYRSTVQARPVLAAAVNQWFRDVNQEKQMLESQVDNLLDKPWVTPLRGGLAAGGLAFAATGGMIGAGPISALVGTYVGWRVGRGLAQGGEFATRSVTGSMLGDMSHLKLGMFFNLMSAVVNTTQVALNTAPTLGTRDTAVGIKRFEKAVRSKLRGRPNADWRLLERNDINPLDTLAEGTRHQFRRQDRLSQISMIFFTGAETFNRGATLLGAVNKAQRQGKTPGEAGRLAREAVIRTQFHYGAAAKPELLRNVFLRVPLQFKNFVAQQLTFLLGLSRKELPKFLLSMALVAGTLGIPGLDALDALADWLFEFSPIAEMKLAALKAAAKGELEDGVLTFLTRGAPGLAGVDMAGRVGMGDKFLPLQVRDWKGAWWSTMENAVRHGREGATVADQLRNLSPGVGNPLKVLENWTNGGMVTNPWKRNRPEYRMTGPEMALKALGGRPLREARLQDLRDVERRDIERRRLDARRYVDRIVRAEEAGDDAEIDRVYEEAEAEGVPISAQSVRRALQAMGQTRAARELRNLPRDLRGRGMELREAIGASQ